MINMKKLLLLIIMSIVLVGTSIIIYKNVIKFSQSSCIQIDTGIMLDKMENQQTFTVYFYQTNCVSCMQVSNIINSYIQETGDEIYAIDLNNTNYQNYLANVLKIQGTPTIIRFVKGKETNRLVSVFDAQELEECIVE